MKNLNTFKLLSDYETKKSAGTLNTPNVSFVAEDNSVIYLLENTFENGYEWVDLGLPSGIKWATCNVGATSPEQAGLYFAWGETTGYTVAQITSLEERWFNEDIYQDGSAASISKDLSPNDGNDAARVNLGGNWRMPTNAEYQELIDNCTVTWTADYNGTGVAGRLFTSKTNGNSVFFPASGRCDGSSVGHVGSLGYYWSASWYSASQAYYLDISGNVVVTFNDRYYGHSMRGVCE